MQNHLDLSGKVAVITGPRQELAQPPRPCLLI